MAEYLIYKENMEGFEKKIATIQRKCQKNNIPFTYDRKGEVVKYINDGVHDHKVPATFIEVEVEGLLKLGNYDVVAKIDHFDTGNIVIRFDQDVPVDQHWWSASCCCRHCNKQIRRKYTYLLKDRDSPSNDLLQVGGSCLKDFTGVNTEAVAEYESIIHLAEDYGDPFKFGKFINEYPLNIVIGHAIDSINEFGYRPTSNPDSTRNDVLDRVKWDEEPLDMNLANEIISWMKGYHDDSDYSMVLNAIAQHEVVTLHYFGYAVSAVNSYYNYQEKLSIEAIRAQQHEWEKKSSDYVGEVGKGINIDVNSCQLVSSGDGAYGYWYLYKFIDKSCNILTWFTSSPCIGKDEKVNKIIATVKDHEEYKGVKQTQLSRVKVIA